MKLFICIILFLMPIPLRSLHAQQDHALSPCAIQGVVLDLQNLPVPGAAVTLNPGKNTVVTSQEGKFCFAHAPSTKGMNLLVSMPGFEPKSIELRDSLELDIRVMIRPTFRQQDVIVYDTIEDQRLLETPVRIDVLGRQTIDMSLSNTMADALELFTGVRVESSCQNCNFAQARLLGLDGAYSQTLVDGLPLISSLAQVYGIEQIPARMIERIEVIKGGGSVAHGAGSVAGAINIISRHPDRTGGVVESRFEDMYGRPNHSHNALVDYASKDKKTVFTAFGQVDGVKPLDYDGADFTEVGRRRLEAVGARASRYLLGDKGQLTFDFSQIGEKRRGGNKLHLPEYLADVAESASSRRSTISTVWKHYILPELDYRLAWSFVYMKRDTYYGSGMDPNAYGETTNPLFVFDSQINRYRGSHVLTLGIQHFSDYLRDAQPAYNRITDDVYRNIGAFTQHSWSFAKGWEALYGVRMDKHSAVSSIKYSPRIAVKWSPREGLNFRGTAARGFRAPQVFNEDLHVTQVGGEGAVIRNRQNLKPESATSFMLGGEWRPSYGENSGLLEINAFSTILRDLFNVIENDDPATGGREFMRVNFGKGRVRGIELNLGYARGNRFKVEGGLVFQKGRYGQPEPDFGSYDFFRTPKVQANLSAYWKVPGLGEIFFGARHSGSMLLPHYAGYISDDRLEKTKSYTVFDANITRELLRFQDYRLALTIGVKNLTNSYQDDLDRGALRDAGYVWGPRFPRTFSVSLKALF